MYEDLFREERKKKEKDVGRVIVLYERAMELLEKGLYEKACQVLKQAVEPFDSSELYNWGAAYYNGFGVSQNYERAVFWFQKSADKGYSEAQRALGLSYYLGLGVDKDYQKALNYLRLAADQNNADALETLGAIYWIGEAVERDEKEALRYFIRAAERGSKKGCYNAARLYCFGEESIRNSAMSWKYLCKLSPRDYNNEDYFKAHYMAGIHYIKQSNSQDTDKAFFHFSAGADKGDQDSQYILGIMYVTGMGTEKNPIAGMDWIEKAADNGSEEAQVFLNVTDDRSVDKAIIEILNR